MVRMTRFNWLSTLGTSLASLVTMLSAPTRSPYSDSDFENELETKTAGHAALKRCFNAGLGGVTFATHQFNEQIDRCGPRKRHRIVEPLDASHAEAAIFAFVARTDCFEFQALPATRR